MPSGDVKDQAPPAGGASRTRRDRASEALLLVAAVVIALAAAALYVNANIFDSSRFADHAQQALAEPEVRAMVVEDIGDLIVNEVAPDAVAVRPLIDTVSTAVIDTAGFQRLFRTAVLQLHEAAIEGDVDNAVLTIANVGIVLSQGLREIAPEVGEQIPEGLDQTLIEIAEFDSIETLTSAADTSHDLAYYLTLLALLLVIGAFAVSANRVRTLGRFGLSLILSGALVIAGYYVAQYLVLRPIVADGLIDRSTSILIWDAFMAELISVAVIMIGLGAVLSVVVDAALGGEPVQRRAGRIVKRAFEPESTRARVGWSLALIAAGLWAALDPFGFLETSITLLGLFAIAIGAQELAVIASPPVERSGEAAAELRRERRRSMRFAAATAIGAMLLVAVIGAIHAGGGIESLGLVRTADACNGDRDLCDRPYDEVAMAATHNSMAVASSPNWLFPAQEQSIATQLDDGIHGLMIDVYYAYPGRRVYTDAVRSSPKARSVMREEFGDEFVDAADRIRRSISKPSNVDSELFMCHGFCELGATKLSEAFDDLRRYLERNPREVVTVIFEDYVPWEDLAAALQRAELDDYAFDGPWGSDWPKLGEMIDSGRRLVLMTEKAEPGVPWMHNAFDVTQETPFRFETVEQLRAPESCDESRGSPEASLFLVNHWVDTPPNPRPSIAKRVNRASFLGERVGRCERRRKLPAGLIAVDFYREGDLITFVDDLNSARE